MQPLGIPLNVVVVGDPGVGKTSLLLKYAMGSKLKLYTLDPVPPIHPNSNPKLTIDGVIYLLHLIDTHSSPEEEVIVGPRDSPIYRGTDTFVLCFSLVNPSSFKNVREKWYPEIRQCYPNAAILLVGTHVDVRERLVTITTPIKEEQGKALAKEICAEYVECSAYTGEAVETVFKEAVKVKVAPKADKRTQPRKRSRSFRCVIS